MRTQDAVETSLTRRLADYVTGLEFATLAPQTVEHAQQAVLDLLPEQCEREGVF